MTVGAKEGVDLIMGGAKALGMMRGFVANFGRVLPFSWAWVYAFALTPPLSDALMISFRAPGDRQEIDGASPLQ